MSLSKCDCLKVFSLNLALYLLMTWMMEKRINETTFDAANLEEEIATFFRACKRVNCV